MDADLTIPKPQNLSLTQAATIGVGIEVSLEEFLGPMIMLTMSRRLLLSEFSMVVTFLFPIRTICLGQRMNGPWSLEAQAPWDASVSKFSNFSVTKSSLHVARIRMRCVPLHVLLDLLLITYEKTVKETGADAVFDYRTSTADQVAEASKVLDETKGNLHYVLDAAAAGVDFACLLFKKLPEVPKYFATTNDWYVRCYTVLI